VGSIEEELLTQSKSVICFEAIVGIKSLTRATSSIGIKINIMAAEKQRENGYQITNDHLSKAIATDKKCRVEEIVIEDISKTEGSNKGENFTCVLFAVEIKAKIKDQSETLNYMIKCMPSNPFRAKFLTDVIVTYN
jgi:hypothetical protein